LIFASYREIRGAAHSAPNESYVPRAAHSGPLWNRGRFASPSGSPIQLPHAANSSNGKGMAAFSGELSMGHSARYSQSEAWPPKRSRSRTASSWWACAGFVATLAARFSRPGRQECPGDKVVGDHRR